MIASENSIASFIPKTSIEEKPLWFFMETIKVGKTLEGNLIIRFNDNDDVEVHHGSITMRKDGIMFNSN